MKTLLVVLALLITGCSNSDSTTNADKLAAMETNFEKNTRVLIAAEKALCNADMTAIISRYKSENLRLAYIRICRAY